MKHQTTIIALALALAASASAAPGRAQTVERAAEGLRMSGRVVDAGTGSPLTDATVVVEPEVLGAFPGAAAGSAFAAAARTTQTDSVGRYQFTGLAPGPYRVYATRYGYRPFSVTVELGRSTMGLSVALAADPIALEPVRSTGHSRGPYVATDPFGPSDQLERARLVVADLRRSRFLATDVRELTHADVVESVTLGEPDLFRALQRLPGVTTRSDYTAALWTRGAPWSQTRVYYDGIPLFNPLHALGMISGISSSAVGSVWFHPGVRSAGIGEGAAGVVDLRSRPAGGLGELNVLADASLATAGIALDQRVAGGRAGWMLAGRASYLDWLADLARRAADQEDAAFPYHFSEISGRMDVQLGQRHALEASGLWEGDQLRSAATEETDPMRASWGNALGRITWAAGVGRFRVQHTVGGSRHSGLVQTDPTGFLSDDAIRRSETSVDYLTLRGALWPDDGALSGPPWTVGYEVTRHGVSYRGPVPLPFPRAEALADAQATVASLPVLGNTGDVAYTEQWTAWDDAIPIVAAWGERRWDLGEVAIRTGLRAETGADLRDAPDLRLAPRLTVRYTPVPELAFSLGGARVWQYAQTAAPSGVHLASLVSTDAWILAGPGVPPLRSDLATVGLEARPVPGRVVTLNTFARRAGGVVLPNPEPGPVLDRNPTLATGRNEAIGVEVSIRQLTGPITGSIAYTGTRSIMRVDDMRFPSAADRTHVLNATGMVRPLPSLRVGAAFTAATGVPFTRSISDPSECNIEPACDPGALPWAGPPNASRGPNYASLDLLVDWATDIKGLNIGVYAQIRNVLGWENATVYAGGSGCLVVGCSIDALRNAYEAGVPRLPVIGIRVQR